mmetsp:Transcript_44829/g.118386  ORF Transcript_44829/g.118386 Transcript_44829/m.118386 type:complete len:660 (+) Transcript_44829:49-2028(+)
MPVVEAKALSQWYYDPAGVTVGKADTAPGTAPIGMCVQSKNTFLEFPDYDSDEEAERPPGLRRSASDSKLDPDAVEEAQKNMAELAKEVAAVHKAIASGATGAEKIKALQRLRQHQILRQQVVQQQKMLRGENSASSADCTPPRTPSPSPAAEREVVVVTDAASAPKPRDPALSWLWGADQPMLLASAPEAGQPATVVAGRPAPPEVSTAPTHAPRPGARRADKQANHHRTGPTPLAPATRPDASQANGGRAGAAGQFMAVPQGEPRVMMMAPAPGAAPVPMVVTPVAINSAGQGLQHGYLVTQTAMGLDNPNVPVVGHATGAPQPAAPWQDFPVLPFPHSYLGANGHLQDPSGMSLPMAKPAPDTTDCVMASEAGKPKSKKKKKKKPDKLDPCESAAEDGASPVLQCLGELLEGPDVMSADELGLSDGELDAGGVTDGEGVGDAKTRRKRRRRKRGRREEDLDLRCEFCGEPGCGEPEVDESDVDQCTIMVRNVPIKFTQRMLLDIWNKGKYAGHFNLFYLPTDFRSRRNLGYCFLNFTSNEMADSFRIEYQGYKLGGALSRGSSKGLQVSCARLQGFEANIRRLRMSAVAAKGVAPEFQPMVFRDGETEMTLGKYIENVVKLERLSVRTPTCAAALQALGLGPEDIGNDTVSDATPA